ncbi:SAM-dependent methyltransferase [Trebonia sp.]|uniref:SAM-dependent methyltransferase n=1 Tax=Trebonia sp. TaxID=2767075 RepID=UPI002614E002|nr:SAM-dependent methyltransferase [Trebonia sp.]
MTEGIPRDIGKALADIDITRPNVARVYDYFVGGKDNFAADREFANKAMDIAPKAPLAAQANRMFLRRVVSYLAGEAGITQFLDIGSGLPTAGNTSEVAHEINPNAHVVYVDNDPVVYTHSKALLADSVTVDIINADIRDPATILTDPAVLRLLDFDRPIGLLLLAVLHHIEDHEDPAWIVARLRDAMPSGSYLAISSFRMPGPELPELRAKTIEGEKLLAQGLGSGRWREEEELRTWFGDWELLPPGFVSLLEWRPPTPEHIERDEVYHSFFGGLARKK